MYCFSQICRICLNHYSSDYKSLESYDENIKIKDKLSFCVPEIICNNTQLPENICNDCYESLKRLYLFKQKCVDNTKILYDYIDKLSSGFVQKHYKLDLLVAMNTIEVKEVKDVEMEEKKNKNDGVSMFSISLNQWDLFETKYTCRCVKEYSSFTENTSHLCQNCEGELHGFRLSKLKMGVAENRYNNSIQIGEIDEDSNISKFDENNDQNAERGFDYNDFLLSKAHLNRIKKEISILSDESDTSFEEKPFVSTPKTETDNKFYCPVCNRPYSRKYSLLQHYVETHPEQKIYHCDYCRLRFVTNDELKQHEVRHRRHIMAMETIKNGGKVNKTFPEMTTETTEISDEDEENLSFNQKRDPNDSLTCSTCDKLFASKSTLAIHLLTHAGTQEYKCKFCGEEFFRRENLEKHELTHKTAKKYECDYCEKSYDYKSNLRRHMLKHKGIFSCSVCTQKFTKKDDLAEHIFTHSKVASNTQKFSCSKCNKVFSHIDHLKTHELFTHQRNYSEENLAYVCKVCNKSFYKLQSLQDHEKTHSAALETGKGAFAQFVIQDKEKKGKICPICNRTYSIKTSMRMHMLTHSNGKIKKCNICNMEFTNKFLLGQHRKTHNEVMQFKCLICDKIYMTNSSLLRHMVSHKL